MKAGKLLPSKLYPIALLLAQKLEIDTLKLLNEALEIKENVFTANYLI